MLRALGGSGLALSMGTSRADDFPTRPITLICPFGAGGSVDQYMRALAAAARHSSEQAVLIDNKPGAGGLFSASLTAKARPDGYTLAMTTGSIFRSPWLEPQVGVRPLTDFSYVIGLTSLEFCAVVRADSPYRTMADFMRAGKAKGGAQFAAGDPTTAVPVLMKTIEERYGARFEHIPYRSGSDMATALMGGHVGIVMDSVGTYVPYVNAGKLRLLAALGNVRLKAWPEVPTASEQGFDIAVSSPMGLIGPKDMSPATVLAVHDLFRKAMQEPGVTRTLDLLNQPEWYRNPKDFTAYAATTYTETGELLRRAKLI